MRSTGARDAAVALRNRATLLSGDDLNHVARVIGTELDESSQR
jgi:hypothetical protein